MDSWDEQYEKIENKKEFTISAMNKIEKKVNDCLKRGDLSELSQELSLCEDERFSMTSEMKRLASVMRIYIFELKYRDCELFISNVMDYKKLFEKYIKTTLLVRRFEFLFDDEFVQEAIDFIVDNKISPEAVITISEDELFANRKKVVYTVYEGIKDKLSKNERAEWLCCMYEKYYEAWLLAEMKELENER